MGSPKADRNLLFGVLAMQMDFISRNDFVAAMQFWVADKSRSLDEILLEQGCLASDTHSLLTPLVKKHLELHNNDPEESLASVGSAADSLRDELEQLDDIDVHDTLARTAAFTADSNHDARAHTDDLSTHGGRFRFLRPHAEGGLGKVSVALDRELNREVALKEILSEHADDPSKRADFIAEAKVTGGLEHPAIVSVYALGVGEEGRPYYAMRFLRGRTLQAAIREFREIVDPSDRPLRFLQLLKAFTDVCNAVSYAHSRGIVHRDIKPGNIVLGEFGEAYLVDWGLALKTETSVDSGVPDTTTDSAEGSFDISGTPMYMSPEQASGKRAGTASDIYSLGATLYELLTGCPPFAPLDDDTSDQRRSQKPKLNELLRRVRNGDFVAPRERAIEIDGTLQRICLKAMATEADDRFQSAREMKLAIERYQTELPLRHWRRAVAHFEDLIHLEPQESEFLLSLARSRHNLAVACWGQQRFDESIDHLKAARTALETLGDMAECDVSRDMANVCLTYSRVLAQTRLKSEALAQYEEAKNWLKQYLRARGKEIDPVLLWRMFEPSDVGFLRFLSSDDLDEFANGKDATETD